MPDDDDQILLEDMGRLLRDLRRTYIRLKQSSVGDDAGSGHPQRWANAILIQNREAPSVLEHIVALSINTNSSLPNTAARLMKNLRRTLTESEGELTKILQEAYPDLSEGAAKMRSQRMRSKLKEKKDSFVLDNKQDFSRFEQHHFSRLVPDREDEELPRLVVVDVLGRKGTFAVQELKKFLGRVRLQMRKQQGRPIEIIVARILLQSQDLDVDDKLRQLASDQSLLDELRERHLFAWFRRPRNPPAHVTPGTVHGNWITSIPYPVDEEACSEIRRRLWVGERIAERRVHHLYFGVHDGSETSPGVYNHFPFDSEDTSNAMRETQRQLARVHNRHWRDSPVSNRVPGPLEVF